MEFYGIEIPLEAQPTFVWLVEMEELRIAGGMQDRVIQCYEGLVYMDFDRSRERLVDGFPSYQYERLDPACLPPLYLAYHDALSEPTEVFHNNIRERYNQGDAQVVAAMCHFAELAAGAREALRDGNHSRLAALMNENFDTRRSIYTLPGWQVEMVEAARACGASAKFAGSGGAIIGTYPDDEALAAVRRRLLVLGSRTIVPQVVP
jgi:glucuronokinase